MKISYPDFIKKFNLSPFSEAPSARELHFVWVFSLPVSASEIWPYLADTSRFNQTMGFSPRQEREQSGQNHVTTVMLGWKQEWIESPWTWVKEEGMEIRRHYSLGMAKKMRGIYRLVPTGTGCDLYVNFSWMPRNRLWRLFLNLTSSALQKQFGETIQSFARQSLEANRLPVLTNAQEDKIFPTAKPRFEKIRQDLKTLDINENGLTLLLNHLSTGDDSELVRIRTVQLAKKWAVPKKDLLRLCLHSVRLGLLSISWDVMCPHCRGVRLKADHLGDIPVAFECKVCEVDFKTDDLESIEVVFHIQPSFRKVVEITYCAAEPAKKDHILIQQNIPPKGSLEFRPPLHEGRHRLRFIGSSQIHNLEVLSLEGFGQLHWPGLRHDLPTAINTACTLRIDNPDDQVRTFVFEQMWWQDDRLHPADIFVLREFQDFFSQESLQSEVKLSLGVQTIMFTDIVNSTVFYNQRGDAAAFGEVKRHFNELFEEIFKNEGGVVKTIGDSVMACFQLPDQALAAAIKIQARFHQQRQGTSIRLRISIHSGPIIAVHLNQGVDYFGSTVNKAAKLQSCAEAGEIACSTEFWQECHSSLFQQHEKFATKKTSTYIFKEAPLEAYVLKTYEIANQTKKSEAS